MAEIASLRNHPGWRALSEHIQAKIDSTLYSFTRSLLHESFDQSVVDRTRGQVFALRAVLNAPQLASQAYAKAKRKDLSEST